ncbi:Arg_ACG [Ostreococcus tauri]|uniref:Arg_ACG n=1 Tax=Ostreococcus tauri TaxID=70448 RepID=A0A098GK86_OSTTA|nr:Arg_ACG [Ostreococcus tauri]CEG62474.1 Arg_ACG [Ostreococcus tauri]|eukprot:XP_022841407.1 Arg_ACG [Ostreococcus tauri]
MDRDHTRSVERSVRVVNRRFQVRSLAESLLTI